MLILLTGIPTALAASDEGYGFKGEYFLARAPYHGEPVCQPFTRNLNQFRKLDFDTCHPRLSSKYPEFTRPAWEKIPFDMAIAEKLVKSAGSYVASKYLDTSSKAEQVGEAHWQKWKNATETLRKEGKARMWRLRADIDGDGEDNTLIRMLPGDRYPLYGSGPASLSNWSCDYNLGELYVVETRDPAVKGQFNAHKRGTDLIRFDGNGHYYLLWWRISSADGEGWSLPNIGATRSVLVERLYLGKPPVTVIGPVSHCFIDWVPTGHYKPVAKPSRKSTKTPSH